MGYLVGIHRGDALGDRRAVPRSSHKRAFQFLHRPRGTFYRRSLYFAGPLVEAPRDQNPGRKRVSRGFGHRGRQFGLGKRGVHESLFVREPFRGDRAAKTPAAPGHRPGGQSIERRAPGALLVVGGGRNRRGLRRLLPQPVAEVVEGETFNPNFMGVALALTAAALWGAGTVLGKYVLSSASFQTMTALRFLLAFVFLLGMNAYQKSFPVFGAVSAKTWLYIVIIAVTSGVVSLFIYYKGLTHTKASIATLAELGFPLAAVLVNYFALRIELQPSQMFGMTLLLFAICNLTKVNRQATESFAMASGNQ